MQMPVFEDLLVNIVYIYSISFKLPLYMCMCGATLNTAAAQPGGVGRLLLGTAIDLYDHNEIILLPTPE